VFCSPRLSCDHLGIQRIRQSRHDFVLHVKEIGDRLVEPLGPKVIFGFGLDQLYVDPEPLAAPLY
jgi:hypothetical protein